MDTPTTVTAIFSARSRSCRTAPIYQYDIGDKLEITGIDLPQAAQVHFANTETGESKTSILQNGQVTIPQEYTQSGAPVYAWLYLADEESGSTKLSIVIPVIARAQITDQEPSPDEQSAIDQTIAALNRAVEQTAQDVTDAQTAATAAQTAQTAAETAQTAAETAAQQAATVQTDVFAARDAAIAAKTAAETAQTQAGQSAQSAATSASSAAAEAENAAESAQTAMTAQASAETAKSGAETAAGEAQTAAADATHERESAMLAAGAAGSAMLNAQTAQTAAETAATASQQSATAAAQSATAANTAKTDAQTAKTGAETARSGAETAQAAAEAALENYDEMEQSVSELRSAMLEQGDAIIAAFEKAVWTDENASEYIGGIVSAYKTMKVESISAVYSGGAVSVLSDINVLTADIVVTANMIDGTTETVPTGSYTIFGTLAPGDNTITVSCYKKTTTITVTADDVDLPSGYNGYDYIKRTLSVGTYDKGSKSIITDISMSSDYVLDMELFVPSTSTSNFNTPVAGVRNSNANPARQFELWANANKSKIGYAYNGKTNMEGGTGLLTDIPFTKGANQIVRVMPVGTNKQYKNYATIMVNDSVYSTDSDAIGKTWSPWLTFFSIGSSSSTTYQGGSLPEIGIRIGRVSIRNMEGTCIHYLIPVYNGTYYGLYDAVGESMYYNADYSDSFICENNQ